MLGLEASRIAVVLEDNEDGSASVLPRRNANRLLLPQDLTYLS